MQDRSSKKKKRRDVNALAKGIVDEDTSDEGPGGQSTDETPQEESSPEDEGKNPNAVALGRLGGLKGGKARAKKLSAEERREIARRAALTRWRKKSSD